MSLKTRVLILNVCGVILIIVNLIDLINSGFSNIQMMDIFTLFIGIFFIGYARYLKSNEAKRK